MAIRHNKLMLSVFAALSLAGCNSGGGDSGTSSPVQQTQSDAPATQTYTLKGVAAVGAALQNGTVKVVDVNGKQYSATIDPVSGFYQVAALQAPGPLLIQATGTFAGQTVTLHSVIVDTPTSGQVTVNVNPITDLALLTAAVQTGLSVKSPADLFALQQQRSPALRQMLTNTNIQNALSTLQEQSLSDEFRELRNKYAAYENPFYGNFAVGSGLDKVLDNIQLKLDTSTGSVAEIIHTDINGNVLAKPKQRTIVVANLPTLSFLTQSGVYTGKSGYNDYTVVVSATGIVDYYLTSNFFTTGYVEAGNFRMSRNPITNAMTASLGVAFVDNSHPFKSIIDDLGTGNGTDSTIVNSGPQQGSASLTLNNFSTSSMAFTLTDANMGAIGRPLNMAKQASGTAIQLADLVGSYADEKSFDPLVNPRASSNCLRITPDSVVIDGHPAELTKDIGTANTFTLNSYFPATGKYSASSIRAKVFRSADGSLQIVGVAPRATRTSTVLDGIGLAFSLKLSKTADRSCN